MKVGRVLQRCSQGMEGKKGTAMVPPKDGGKEGYCDSATKGWRKEPIKVRFSVDLQEASFSVWGPLLGLWYEPEVHILKGCGKV